MNRIIEKSQADMQLKTNPDLIQSWPESKRYVCCGLTASYELAKLLPRFHMRDIQC